MPAVPRRMVGSICLVLALALTACRTGDSEGSGSSVVPTETAQDWVTYGDVLARMTVTAERRVEPSQEEIERGEGTIGRRITLRVDEPVWRRPALPAGMNLPRTLETGGGFWAFQGRNEQRAVPEGREWLEVGKSYFALFAYMDAEYGLAPTKSPADADPTWGPLVWLGLDGTITSVPAGDVGPDLAKKLKGATESEVVTLLSATPPDPFAAPYMAEDPALRYQHTFSAREHATAEPAESASPPRR